MLLCTSILALFFAAVQGEIFLSGSIGVLPCVANTDDSDLYTWTDTTAGSSSPLYRVDVNGVRETPAVTGTVKYENFSVVNDFPNSVNLSINPVTLESIGTYQCAVFNVQDFLEVLTLDVEVATDRVTLSCGSCNGGSTESTCQCTCLAEGGYPSSLTIGWTTTAGNIVSSNMEPAEERNGKFDFTGTAEVTVIANEAVVTCSVDGYVNQAVIEEDFSDRVSQEQVLASPTDCTLVVSKVAGESQGDGCTVQLNCSCQGVPPINSCKFYNGTQDNEIPDKNSCVANHLVQLGTEGIFLCSGSNGINFVKDLSDPVPYECLEIEPTPSATTPNKTGDADPGTTGSPNGLVIGLSVVGSLIAVAVIVIIILFVLKRWKNPTERKNNAKDFDLSGTPQINAVTATTGDTSSAPVYGVIDKSKKKKSDKTDGNGMQMSEAPEYAAVSKPLNSEPKPAPRSSQPPPTNSTEKQELQYADIDHSNRTPSNQIRQPAEEPTEYATVQSSVIV